MSPCWTAESLRDEDLAGNLETRGYSKNFTTGQYNDRPPEDYTDLQGHGTHVSGTVGAAGNNGKGVVGVNWRTKIIT
ncbi:MAG: S8 family serine peptidase, partial [Synergistaceae bacterium]|nr:S8 family serine peptidase [Synergistaceae bacterium]